MYCSPLHINFVQALEDIPRKMSFNDRPPERANKPANLDLRDNTNLLHSSYGQDSPDPSSVLIQVDH